MSSVRIFKISEFSNPVAIASHRLRWLQWSHANCAQFCASHSPINVWTDGSVLLQESFWLTTAGYAVVAEDESCIASGQVCHISLSSCAAELFAVLIAVQEALLPYEFFQTRSRLQHVLRKWSRTMQFISSGARLFGGRPCCAFGMTVYNTIRILSGFMGSCA